MSNTWFRVMPVLAKRLAWSSLSAAFGASEIPGMPVTPDAIVSLVPRHAN